MNAIPILSSKLGSSDIDKYSYAGFIDTIEMKVNDPELTVRVIKVHSSKHLRFKDSSSSKPKRYFLNVFHNNKEIGLKLFYNVHGDIFKVRLSPALYSHWDDFIFEISMLFSKINITELLITRIDFSADVLEKFSKLSKGVLLKGKSCITAYDSKAGVDTGIYFGKSPKQILIYDKSKLIKSNYDYSRIEVSLIQSAIPVKTILDLPRYFKSLSLEKENPLFPVTLNKFSVFLHPKKKDRSEEAMYQLRSTPLVKFKKLNNRNNNFDRDYKDIIDITQDKIQPAYILMKGLQGFIKRH